MKKCLIKECLRRSYCTGLCSVHYNRLRTTGTVEDGLRARLPFEKRLWKYIKRRKPNECWPWIGKSKVDGYGTLGRGSRKDGKVLAHRAVWELEKGPIPESDDYHGTVVMHSCDNRACCNPKHLKLGTQADNVADMDAKGRRVYTNPWLNGREH